MMEPQRCIGKDRRNLYCRAAEISSIECAKILLEYNADIDALNFSGHTALHTVSFFYFISFLTLHLVCSVQMYWFCYIFV